MVALIVGGLAIRLWRSGDGRPLGIFRLRRSAIPYILCEAAGFYLPVYELGRLARLV